MAKSKQKDELLFVETLTELLSGTSEASPMARSKIPLAQFGPNATARKKSLKATIVHMEAAGTLAQGARGALYLTGKKASSRKRAAPAQRDLKKFPWSDGMSDRYFKECREYWKYVEPRLEGWGLKHTGPGRVTENVFLGKWAEVMASGGVTQKKVVRLLREEGFKGKKYALKDFDTAGELHDSEAAYKAEMARIAAHEGAGKPLSTLKPSKPIPVVRKPRAAKESEPKKKAPKKKAAKSKPKTKKSKSKAKAKAKAS